LKKGWGVGRSTPILISLLFNYLFRGKNTSENLVGIENVFALLKIDNNLMRGSDVHFLNTRNPRSMPVLTFNIMLLINVAY
jgi:hypothetical protein